MKKGRMMRPFCWVSTPQSRLPAWMVRRILLLSSGTMLSANA
jgi:hypothetical protein